MTDTSGALPNEPNQSATILGGPSYGRGGPAMLILGFLCSCFIAVLGIVWVVNGELEGFGGVVIGLVLASSMVAIYRVEQSRTVAITRSGSLWWKKRGRWCGPLLPHDITGIDVFSITVFAGADHRTTTTVLLVTDREDVPTKLISAELRKVGFAKGSRAVKIALDAHTASKMLNRLRRPLESTNIVLTDRARDALKTG